MELKQKFAYQMAGFQENQSEIMDNITVNASAVVQAPFEGYDLSVVIPMSTFLIIVILLSIFGNSMVIITIVRHKAMRTRTNMFIANLAVSDILAAIFDMPISLVTLIEGKWIFGEAFCQFNGFTMALFLISSVHTLMYISIHKYISIARPFSRFMTPRRILIMIIFSWVWSLAYAGGAVAGWNRSVYKAGATQCGPSYPNNLVKMTHSLVNTLANFLIPLLVMTLCYCLIFCEIRRHMCRMRETSNIDNNNSLMQQKRISVTLFMVMACFLLCMSPYVVYSCSAAFLKAKSSIPIVLNPLSYWFIYASSACNPIIYAFRSPSFRQGYMEIVCGRTSHYYSGGSFRSASQRSWSFRSSYKNQRVQNSVTDQSRSRNRFKIDGADKQGFRRSSDTSWKSMSFRERHAVERSIRPNSIPASENDYHQQSSRIQNVNGTKVTCELLSQDTNAILELAPVDERWKAEPDFHDISLNGDKCKIPEKSLEASLERSLTPRKQQKPSANATPSPTCRGRSSNYDKHDDTPEKNRPNNSRARRYERRPKSPASDDTDAFYDSDVEVEHKSEQIANRSRHLRKLRARSCMAKCSDKKSAVVANLIDAQFKLVEETEKQSEDVKHLERAHSWTDIYKSHQIPSDKIPLQLLRKPLIDYLDMPKSRARRDPCASYLDVPEPVTLSKCLGHSEGNLCDGVPNNRSPLSKKLTNSFKHLFRKSRDKHLEGESVKSSSESVI